MDEHNGLFMSQELLYSRILLALHMSQISYIHNARTLDWPLLVFTTSAQINVYYSSSFKAEHFGSDKHKRKFPEILNKAVRCQICQNNALKYVKFADFGKL